MKLPKIIHQIWIGPDPIPEECKMLAYKMQEMHPDWEYKLWDNEAVFEGQFKDDPYLKDWKDKISSDYLLQPAFISDRVRLLILKAIGGIYVDMDALAIKPFDTLLDKLNDNITFFAGASHGPSNEYGIVEPIIDVTVLGAVPNCRIINKLLSSNDFPMSGLHISRDLFKYLDFDMAIFGKDYFYSDKDITENTIIIHEPIRLLSWAHSGIKPWWMEED